MADDKPSSDDHLSNECLLDGFLTLYDECTHSNLMRIKNVSSFVKKYDNAVNTHKHERMKASDFEVKAVIGRGHFGEVRVVREKATDEVYAMKVLRKTDLLAQPEISFFEEERDIMATSDSPWITQLHFAFQDSANLYLVMDFHAGGDLLSLLARHDDILEEDMAKFYIAEMAVAINTLHEKGYLHRDIKPENVLIDYTGHVKLADFGSAAKLDKTKKVSAHMPVGTPDYVAPELLVSMNKGRGQATYGPEVDWWSLGVCAFEMLFGSTPFTSESTSMVSTYANIMNFKKTLRFPSDSDVSSEAKDFIKKLLTDAQFRLSWQDIKSHPFFSGIKWDTIRDDDAIYVPSINGLDDTSHFEEVEKVQHQPDIERLMPQRDFCGRDLPFVGFTFTKHSMDNKRKIWQSSPGAVKSPSSNSNFNNSNVLNTACLMDHTSVVGLDSHALQIIAEKDQEITKLRRLLEREKRHWNEVETTSVSLIENLNSMNSEIRSFEDELLEVKLEEMKGEIILLETEQEKLTAQLRSKEQQLAKTKAALDEANMQLQNQQIKLDKERRKSRDDQRRDLMLLELRNETWESLLEDKQATIEELMNKVQELEDLVEAYEDSEEKQATEVQHLHRKMNTTLPDISSQVTVTDVRLSGETGEAKVELDNFHHNMCPSKKKLTLHVTLKAGRCSFQDNRTVHKLQTLQKLVDKYAENAQKWREKEEELLSKISSLESDNHTLQHREGMGKKIKDNLMDKVTSYQQEVEVQKGIIKELQGTMRSYLDKTTALSGTEMKLKETQQTKLDLETELMAVKEEAEKTRQSALEKTNQMEDAIKKLEEQRALARDYKNRYDCQVEAAEAKIRSIEEELAKATSDRQRLERRETNLTTQVETLQGLLDDRNLEIEKLERRNTDIQSHLQQLQQRNSELQVQVENLQKASGKNDEQQKSKAELGFQVNRLQQQNTDLEHRLTSAVRDKHSLDDKITLVEREKERLMRRIERLESYEKEKNELESKLEKMSTLERENRRLEIKVERLTNVEKDKLNVEEKLEKLQMDLRRNKITIESLTADKKDVERKLADLQKEKVASSNEEVAQLKMKVALMDTTEKEKAQLEKQLKQMKDDQRTAEKDHMKVAKLQSEKEVAVKEKERIERENNNLKRQIESLEKEKENMEKKMTDLKKEKATSDEHLAKLNKEVDRLESSLGKLQEHKGADNSDVSKLSMEVNRLKLLVDKLEKERTGEQKDPKRSSAEIRSNLIDRLQREKAELQKQVEALEKQVSAKESGQPSNRRTSLALLQEGSSFRRLRQESDEKVKKLEAEVTSLKSKIKEMEREATTKSQNNTKVDELERKCKDLEEQVSSLRNDLKGKKNEVEELKSRLEVQTANVAELRAEVEELMKTENDLIVQLEKEAKNAKYANEEKEKLAAQLKMKESEDTGPRRAVTEAIAKDRQISELSREKNDLESKVSQLQRQLSISRKPATGADTPARKSGELKFEKIQQDAKIRELTEERDELQRKLRTATGFSNNQAHDSELATQVKDLQEQLEESKKEMEIRKGASEISAGDIPAYLRHELQESNLALSEARSLLAASKRQELELRDRIDKLQRILDNKAVENGKYLQNSQDAMADFKSLKSQHDTLQRQYKILEDKYASLQKEKGSNSTETVRLMEEIHTKQHQYEMELKKVEQLTGVCAELEEQLKDMDKVLAEFKRREEEWENIKKTYEKAVDEREDEIEGATSQLQAISMAKSAASEKVSSMKQQVESVKALHKADVEKLNHMLWEEKARSQKLSAKLAEQEERVKSSTEVFDSQMREMERSNQEKMKMKAEMTELLSDNCTLRKENVMLRKHLDEAMDKFEMIIGEKVSLENFTEALQGLHFLDKYKFESTIGQQMKLIDYLQDLYMEHTGKKKKSKFFGSKSGGKDGTLRPASVPLSWTDLQTALEQERGKANILQEQVDRLREENFQQANEILKLKQSSKEAELNSSGKIDRVQANLTVKVTNSAMKALTHSPASQPAQMVAASSVTSLESNSSSSSGSSRFSGSSSSSRAPHTPRSQRRGHMPDGRAPRVPEPAPTPQRMHHNIPHRFATGLNTRAAKCGLCLGTVYFVRQASKCQECGMVVHPKCASSVPATCGLPTEYVRHFALMMSRIYRDETGCKSDVDDSAVKMEGWLKIPRIGKAGWENRYCVLEGTWLMLYLDERDANPVDSFDLNPMDADVSVHSAVTSAELTNTASTDLHYVLRLDQDPLTTCWPGRYLYLMTTNFQEKQRWVASLEAVVKSSQCKNDLYRNRSQTLTIMSLKDDDRRDFNCTLVISSQLVLVGTDDGLYAFNPQALTSKRKQMTQLTGFGSVHQMALAKGVDLILVLTGPERRLVMLENKLVKCRMSQTLGGETTPFSFRMVEGLQCCTIFDVGLWNNASYLCVGTPTKVYLMKYNPSLAMYCVRKEFPSSEPCSCVCIAENYAIVGTERFYKINLEHPSLLDFVDRQDSSLAFAAYGAANHNSFPLAVVRVSPPELPLEFLLCFHEFGVFVDHHGQRSRATDVKWSGLPLAFAFVDPFLYVTYTNTIQATVVPTDKASAKGRQTVIDVLSPRYLGPAPSYGCVYISSSNTNTNITEIICIRGQEDFCTDVTGDKENRGSKSQASDKQVHFATSPRKTPQIHRLRKQGSLTSLNSNSSAGTLGSIESDV